MNKKRGLWNKKQIKDMDAGEKTGALVFNIIFFGLIGLAILFFLGV